MKTFLKILSLVMTFITALAFSLVYIGEKIVPDKITVIEGCEYKAPQICGFDFYSAKSKTEASTTNGKMSGYSSNAQITLLNIIPIKSAEITSTKRQYVTLGGQIFGIKLYTDGVIVVSTDSVETENGAVNPAAKAGIKVGDIITKVDSETVNSVNHLAQIFQQSNGKELSVRILRNGTEKTVKFKTYSDTISGKYKAGIWVRDSTAGIGTVTFYNDNCSFAGLGHGVYDVDTEDIMPIKSGEMAEAYISGFYKSSVGNVGELCGVFTGNKNGILCLNNEYGIYGYTNNCMTGKKIPVAVKQEVKEGYAQIYCTVDKGEPQYYDIKITKVNTNSPSVNKDMVIEITDEKLLEKTGGILQGMSGSPIIQNGMLIGAVTHVFVNNPKQGYAIFAERMVEICQSSEMKKYESSVQKAS